MSLLHFPIVGSVVPRHQLKKKKKKNFLLKQTEHHQSRSRVVRTIWLMINILESEYVQGLPPPEPHSWAQFTIGQIRHSQGRYSRMSQWWLGPDLLSSGDNVNLVCTHKQWSLHHSCLSTQVENWCLNQLRVFVRVEQLCLWQLNMLCVIEWRLN